MQKNKALEAQEPRNDGRVFSYSSGFFKTLLVSYLKQHVRTVGFDSAVLQSSDCPDVSGSRTTSGSSFRHTDSSRNFDVDFPKWNTFCWLVHIEKAAHVFA
jgi:hypothetical protein